MIYFYMCLCELVFICWSYMFVKTYQLCAYKPNEFLNCVLSLNFSFGDKNRLNFTKSFALFFIIFYFINNFLLILLDLVLIFIFEPVILIASHYITYPIEKLIKIFYMKKAKSKLKKKKGYPTTEAFYFYIISA